MIKVLFIQRRPSGAQISIERLFEGVRRHLDAGVEASVFVCPFPSRGFLPRLRNVLAARSAAPKGTLCHITGDVHYLALGLPPERTILTIHDCAVLHRLTGWRRELVRKVWFEWPVRRSKVVTVISEATRRDLMRWLPARLHDRVRVVPNSVGSEFKPAPKDFDTACPVILQVGTGWNKNLERLVEALQGLRCRLEIIGPLSGAQRDALVAAGIEFVALGRVDDSALVDAYRRCDLLVFASLFEGFGLPVVEAQATGRPVIASRRGSLGEVAGEGALFVDPEDANAIRNAVTKVMADPELRNQLVGAGFGNVRRFQPKAIADSYLKIYREALPVSGRSG